MTGTVKPGQLFGEGDYRNTIPRFNTPEYFKANMKFVDYVKELAIKKQSTPAAIAIA